MDTAPARRLGRRPNFSTLFKRRVVEASYQPDTSVSMIAREHDVNASMVFRWRQQYQDGVFGPVTQSATLLPVEVIEAPIDLPSAASPQQACHSEILLEVQKAKLRITGTPDSQTLQLTLQQLLRCLHLPLELVSGSPPASPTCAVASTD
ncbi:MULTISPECIES: IS66-like element accessory protein TnpA [Pseudomonas]|uniref:IS66-like element accessory protein TnpA n=1 Tax=Pseudomonas TaxID=286 RepID=UPI00209773DA|nr:MULTISPECIES: transposase [Pseudomonas]MCO7579143.1 transposase [Pseudomonas protegens]MCO7585126.1 transposase [Pseudomonas chlororaphis]MCO7602229.1 transposase [Pseudomonas chlororaphis]MDC7818878.1 transposase [Pseudomonas sp. BLCC-B112]